VYAQPCDDAIVQLLCRINFLAQIKLIQGFMQESIIRLFPINYKLIN
jgi:hypothetical protein